jgi:signal transduction histidine kinase
MKSDFINRATHELRTPIATMLLMVNLIEDSINRECAPCVKDDYYQYWDVLKSELNRERILVEDLLSAGRLENGQLHFHFSSFNIVDLINQVIHQLEVLAREKNISISLETGLQPESPSALIQADEKALTQVFMNLIGNAIKFTPFSGNVRIVLQRIHSDFEISIIDTGMGIPSEDLPLLFTRFFRGTNAIENEIPGTGIGLFIVRSILEKHDGKINVRSELGKGTQFEISLPAGC